MKPRAVQFLWSRRPMHRACVLREPSVVVSIACLHNEHFNIPLNRFFWVLVVLSYLVLPLIFSCTRLNNSFSTTTGNTCSSSLSRSVFLPNVIIPLSRLSRSTRCMVMVVHCLPLLSLPSLLKRATIAALPCPLSYSTNASLNNVASTSSTTYAPSITFNQRGTFLLGAIPCSSNLAFLLSHDFFIIRDLRNDSP